MWLMLLHSSVKGNKIMSLLFSYIVLIYASVINCITIPHVAMVWTGMSMKRFVLYFMLLYYRLIVL